MVALALQRHERLDKKLYDALRYMSNIFDTPISRRKIDDEYATDARKTAWEAREEYERSTGGQIAPTSNKNS